MTLEERITEFEKMTLETMRKTVPFALNAAALSLKMKDARIAALEAENNRLRETVEAFARESNWFLIHIVGRTTWAWATPSDRGPAAYAREALEGK